MTCTILLIFTFIFSFLIISFGYAIFRKLIDRTDKLLAELLGEQRHNIVCACVFALILIAMAYAIFG